MKKILYLASILLAGTMITMYSCTKQNEVSKNDQCTSCQDGLLLAKKINNFKAQLLKAKDNPKDGEVMTKEDAKDNMQLLFNASHGFPTDTYTQISVDTVEFILPTDADGNVLMTDVLTKYYDMKGLVKGVYDNNTFTDKHLVSLSLKMEEESGTTTVKAVSTIGGKGIDPSIIFDHCWWYGEDKGYCDTPWGTEDGGDRIAAEIFAHRPGFSCPQGYHSVSDLDYTETFIGNETICNGYIFFMENPLGIPFTDDEKHLDKTEMNAFYYSEYDFLFNVLPQSLNKPDNWLLTSIVINAWESTNSEKRIINHPNDLEYSLVHCVPDDIIEPPVDL